MDFLKNIKGFTDDISKKKLFFFAGIAAALIILIIIISAIASAINKKTSYENVEDIMVEAAYKYLKNNQDLLPNETNLSTSINADVLIKKEYMKELSKYTKDDSCNGKVVVTYNDDDYLYQGYLTCKNYKTRALADKIIEDSIVVENGDGLYDESEFYRYRGEYVNNYLKIGDTYYRILKIGKDNKIYITLEDVNTSDETTYLYWDDRYNSDEDSSCGINDYNLSRMKRSLNAVYESLDDLIKKNITTYSACIGKRSEINSDNSGLTECASRTDEVKISLMPVYEYIKGSIAPGCKTVLSRECKNYNYLILEKSSWWTLTADSSNTYKVYYITSSGEIDKDRGATRRFSRYVVALRPETLFKDGNGTLDKPYTIR